mmetsp:Transcript_45854/g.106584  ORF Transcript_45854/g.106584 Transcript_45854/m.106584 type:complete len:890 (+) Transcript_45854:131-2800(+)
MPPAVQRDSFDSRRSPGSPDAMDSRESRSPMGSMNVGMGSLAVGKGPRLSRTSLTDLRGLAGFHYRLSQTSWFRSPLAHKTRVFLQRRDFALFMFIALSVALFMPDIWVIAGIDENTILDILLSVVMALFTLELLALSLSDPSYVFSFFFLMDAIGTLSMMVDISYMLGQSADEVVIGTKNDGSQTANLMFLRAARAAKVGARAGRLSRVVRFLRFLPFLAASSSTDETSSRGISAKLANLLATRVALLTIILVMVIPLFEILSFPQQDHSFQTWAERLHKDYVKNHSSSILTDLNEMSAFFSRHAYGPFMACIGETTDTDFVCTQDIAEIIASDGVWTPEETDPPVRASILIHHHDNLVLGYNMHVPRQEESALAMASMCFIVFMMIFSGLALSSVVNELAVRPLERMLATVRVIATVIFKFSATLDSTADEDVVDVEHENEINLLERVVNKLAAVADLQATASQERELEDLGDEDIGILNMVQGKNLKDEKERQSRRSVAAKNSKRRTSTLPSQMNLEDALGITLQDFSSFNLNILEIAPEKHGAIVIITIHRFHAHGDGFIKTRQDETVWQSFVEAARQEYLPNPFHSFAHAADVCHATSLIMRWMCSEGFLTELEQHALLIAAVSHDLGHPGVTNQFLTEVGHELALKYNDRSPLENMHCAKLYTLVSKESLNIFAGFSRENFKQSRKDIIEAILHTDMGKHQGLVKDLQLMYQMNAEHFGIVGGTGSMSLRSDSGEKDGAAVFNQASSKPVVMNTIVHAADVSNPCRAWPVTKAWAMQCLEEFFSQGDQEKALGIPVQFLNDRDKVNRPNSQIGFIEFMIAPFVSIQIKLWRRLSLMGDHLAENIVHWEQMWHKEAKPSEEEREKVRLRVKKVQMSLDIMGSTI